MVFKREDTLKSVADGLAWAAKSCELRGVLRLFDNNVLSHHFFCRLLNRLYGLKLEVMDRIQNNYPAIDLGDTERRIAYQITTEKSGGKVQHTLDMFVKQELQAKFDKLKILVIGERQDRYTALTVPQEIVFDPSQDIIDIKGLLKDVEALSTPLLEGLALIFKEELNSAKEDFRITNRTSGLYFENTEVNGGKGNGGPGGDVRIKPVMGGNVSFIGGSIRGSDGGEGGGKGGDVLVAGSDGSILSTARVATHIGTFETVNVDHCERHGRPVRPAWLESHPERMGSAWLADRLLNGSELQLYFDPRWCGGIWFVADMAVGDGVVINPDQLAEIRPPSPTTTTTPAPQSDSGTAKRGQTQRDEAVPFLKSHLRTLQEQYETVQNLCPQDFLPAGNNPPTTSEYDERCARLADQYGFDGTLFRNLFLLHPDRDGVDYILLLRRLGQQIETIPRIIAAIESR